MNDFATAVIAAIVMLSSHPRTTTKVKNTNVPVAMERVALNVKSKGVSMAKIAEMTDHELEQAMEMMARVPRKDAHFSGFNFDPEEWQSKFHELIAESVKRNHEEE